MNISRSFARKQSRWLLVTGLVLLLTSVTAANAPPVFQKT